MFRWLSDVVLGIVGYPILGSIALWPIPLIAVILGDFIGGGGGALLGAIAGACIAGFIVWRASEDGFL